MKTFKNVGVCMNEILFVAMYILHHACPFCRCFGKFIRDRKNFALYAIGTSAYVLVSLKMRSKA